MKYAQKAEQSWTLRKVSEVFHSNPQNLALGVAEGMILFKLSFPVTMALEFYAICQAYMWWKSDEIAERKATLAAGQQEQKKA